MLDDLLSRLGSGAPGDDAPDDDTPDVPDDLSGLDDSDHADDGDELPADPPPRRRRASAPRPAAGTRVSPADRRKVKDALTLLLRVPAAGWALRDPLCGRAAAGVVDSTVASLVPIICRNPQWLRWFTAGNAPWLDILGLITALQPLISTVWGHHVTHTIPVPQEGGGGNAPDLSIYTTHGGA